MVEILEVMIETLGYRNPPSPPSRKQITSIISFQVGRIPWRLENDYKTPFSGTTHSGCKCFETEP